MKKYFIFLALISAAVLAAALRRTGAVPLRDVPAFRASGPAGAPVAVFEFSDFACPACKSAWAGMEEFSARYPDAFRVQFKHYPLAAAHPNSFDAAVHAECAGEQGRFAAFAGELFSGQKDWGAAAAPRPFFSAYAAKAGLDAAALDACVRSSAPAERVKADMAEGSSRSVESTPTFFVNGRRAVGRSQLSDALWAELLARKLDRP